MAELGLLLVLAGWFASRHRLRHTTLWSAWAWTGIGLTGWALLAGAMCWRSAGQDGRLWYLLAVLMLVPPLAVLGARRPASRVWLWFVLLPMLAVLGWPAWVAFGTQAEGFRLETPAALGWGLALVMGTGNYFGTRFTGSVLLLALALTFLVAPLSVHVPAAFPSAEHARTWASLLLVGAGLLALLRLHQETALSRSTAVSRYTRLWLDFRDCFGIVWAKRVMDRLNQTAEAENWSVRVDLDGFQAVRPDQPLPPEVHQKIEHALRWLLRRFVDPPWIDERLAERNPEEEISNPAILDVPSPPSGGEG